MQSFLVVSHRAQLHRRLGIAGGVLAAAIVVVGWMTAVDALRRHVGPYGMDPRTWFLSVPLAGTLLFGTFVAVALVRRRSPDAHRRLMLLATISCSTRRWAGWLAAISTQGSLDFLF
jgi:hypothetical protein